ncbi:MAG: outer membrane beta-barrel protein, partial [Bacteroidetes bacterium]|nr:outer membrane beta-barrel protein [Bacteroidota bacterium]
TSVGLTDSVAKYSALKQEAEARVALTSDQEADVKQVGTAFTPILGVNLMLLDNKMNIGIKYEFQTDIELENQTTKDIKVGFAADGTPITMFPDGAKSRSDMPALLSIGVGYNVNEKIRASVGYHYYFDKDADYGKKDVAGVYVANDKIIDNNYYEIGLGLEYKLSEKLLVSAGYLRAVTGVNYDLYQTDLSYSLTSATVGGGCAYKINDKFEVNLGCSYTAYENGFKNYIHSMGGMVDVPVIDTYDKDALIFGIGLDIHL